MKNCKHNTHSDSNGSLNVRKIAETIKQENDVSFYDFANMLKDKCEKSNIKFKLVKKS